MSTEPMMDTPTSTEEYFFRLAPKQPQHVRRSIRSFESAPLTLHVEEPLIIERLQIVQVDLDESQELEPKDFNAMDPRGFLIAHLLQQSRKFECPKGSIYDLFHRHAID